MGCVLTTVSGIKNAQDRAFCVPIETHETLAGCVTHDVTDQFAEDELRGGIVLIAANQTHCIDELMTRAFRPASVGRRKSPYHARLVYPKSRTAKTVSERECAHTRLARYE